MCDYECMNREAIWNMVFFVCISDPKLFFGIISQTKKKKKEIGTGPFQWVEWSCETRMFEKMNLRTGNKLDDGPYLVDICMYAHWPHTISPKSGRGFPSLSHSASNQSIVVRFRIDIKNRVLVREIFPKDSLGSLFFYVSSFHWQISVRKVRMASAKTYRRSIVESDVLFTMVDRVNRFLIRLSNNINDSSQYPSLDELLILCTALSPKACIPFSRQFVSRCIYWWTSVVLLAYCWGRGVDSQHHQEGIEGSTSVLFRRVILI